MRTPMLNALRCGLRVDELFEKAPGLEPARLFAAYHHLEERRAEANLAWTSITIAGRIEVFNDHRAEAATLLPSLVTRLDEVTVDSPDGFDLVVLQLAAAVASIGAAARRIERVIEASPDDSERAVELGRVLYNHTGAGLSSRPDGLRDPARCGEVVAIGPGEVRRRGGDGAPVEVLAAGACRELGRDVVLVRLAPRR
ncbi:MAG: hypothetical protein ACR2O6_09495 [Ilumatobacteraceae bacterium]